MKKGKPIGLLSIMAAATALNGFASGLVPEQCTIGDRQVCYPIVDVGFTFDGAIAVTENSIATVFSDGQPVETGVLSCSNHEGKKRTQGTAVITFETPLLLPKGKTYRLVVPEGVIYREGNPAVSNEKLDVEFSVPATLGPAASSVEEGSVVEKTDRIGFYFGVETAPVDGGKAMLLRGDVPVREYDCDVSWDWNLGYAGIDFGGTVNFEAGVEYTVMLPEGSVSSLHRPDITNGEISVSFIGGHTEPVAPIQYVWCSLFDNHPSGVLGEVKYYYNRPVALCVNPIVLLYNESDGITVKEAVPTVSEESGQYVMTVDFDNTPLIPEKGYTIIIPEGTLVTAGGDVVVNSRTSMAVGGVSGMSGFVDTDFRVSVGKGAVYVDKTTIGSEILLFSLDGEPIYKAISDGGPVTIPVTSPGVCLLSINGKTYKIAVGQ